MQTKPHWFRFFFCSLSLFFVSIAFSQTDHFDYKRYLFGTIPTLRLAVHFIDTGAGYVTINGEDSRGPSTPFTWHWGDGSVTIGFFPQSHIYTDRQKNYLVKVIARYSDGTKDSSEVLVKFVAPTIAPIEIPSLLAVKIPENKPILGTRLYTTPVHLTGFQDDHFTTVSRSTLEYILSVCAIIQNDFLNSNVFLFNDKFEQIMLRDSTFGGAYSLWFTNPVAFGVGEGFLGETIQYSSFFHEMGHNFTLNTPANYYYGGRIDGNANAIYSESMAQIFQHAAGYEIINNFHSYGLSNDLMSVVKQNMISSVGVIRNAYDRFIESGKHFASWNEPNTIQDETFDTFMTIAYKFLEKAETSGLGYKNPLQRMMRLLQGFKPNWAQRYDQHNNTAEANTFRATLMATAISFAFSMDLRTEFRNLNFPISDSIYNELYYSVTSVSEDHDLTGPFNFFLDQNYPNPFNSTTIINFSIPRSTFVTLKIYDILGREIITLIAEEIAGGNHSVQWDASNFSSGLYHYRLSADGLNKTRQLVFLR
jgi:hypothetical protein